MDGHFSILMEKLEQYVTPSSLCWLVRTNVGENAPKRKLQRHVTIIFSKLLFIFLI